MAPSGRDGDGEKRGGKLLREGVREAERRRRKRREVGKGNEKLGIDHAPRSNLKLSKLSVTGSYVKRSAKFYSGLFHRTVSVCSVR